MVNDGPIEEILSLLEGVIPDGKGHKACFPAHDDQTLSLSISVGDDGRALLRCHAGECEWHQTTLPHDYMLPTIGGDSGGEFI